MITEIKKGDRFKCIIPHATATIEGKIYTANEDGSIDLEPLKFSLIDKESITALNKDFAKVNAQTVSIHAESNEQPLITLPAYYNNEKGSLYQIAEQRGWNSYTFDVVKRLDRGGKKDPLKQEIEKSIGVLQLWLREIPE